MVWRVVRFVFGLMGASLVCGIAVAAVSRSIFLGIAGSFKDFIGDVIIMTFLTQIVIMPCVWLGGIPCFLVLRKMRKNLLSHYIIAGLNIAVWLGGITFLLYYGGMMAGSFVVFTVVCTLIAPVVFWCIVRPDRWQVKPDDA